MKLFVFAVICFFTFIIILFAFDRGFTPINDYKGLGKAAKYPENNIDMSGFYQNKDNFRDYKKGFKRGMVGIDVSSYQKKVNWQKVAKSGVEFAMIRLGYSDNVNGDIYMDKQFNNNIEGAEKNGIKAGVYFFSQATDVNEAIKEANYVLKTIDGMNVDMPVAFDMEPVTGNDRISPLSEKEKTEIADAFCSVIKRGGYEPLIYGNPDWIRNNLNLSYLTEYDIWLAHYSTTTGFPYKFIMWQYSDSGIVDGIEGRVDLNVYIK